MFESTLKCKVKIFPGNFKTDSCVFADIFCRERTMFFPVPINEKSHSREGMAFYLLEKV